METTSFAAPQGSPAAGEATSAWLYSAAGGPAPFALAASVTRIGRGDPVSGYSPDVDLRSDEAVSRRHAEIRSDRRGYHVVDCGSTNGTLVNGEVLDAEQPRL